MLITRATRGPQTWFWVNSIWNLIKKRGDASQSLYTPNNKSQTKQTNKQKQNNKNKQNNNTKQKGDTYGKGYKDDKGHTGDRW